MPVNGPIWVLSLPGECELVDIIWSVEMEEIRKPQPSMNTEPTDNPLQIGLSALLALVLAMTVAVLMREQGLWAASNYAAVVGVCMSIPWARFHYRRTGGETQVFLFAINRAAIASALMGTAAAWLTNFIL